VETCAKARIGRHLIPEPAEPATHTPVSLPIYKIKCRHCEYGADNIKTSRAAEAKANAHSVVHGHDVSVMFDILDCLMTVVRVEEVR